MEPPGLVLGHEGIESAKKKAKRNVEPDPISQDRTSDQ
jgi:hypothetical protein